MGGRPDWALKSGSSELQRERGNVSTEFSFPLLENNNE